MSRAVRQLPLVRAEGGAYERGWQHGRACGDLIGRYPDVLAEVLEDEGRMRALSIRPGRLTRAELCTAARAFAPSLEAFAPHLMHEIRGIADGAERPFDEVLLINVRAEVLGLLNTRGAPLDGCTAFAVGPTRTVSGAVLAGQNLDQDPRNGDLLIVLHVVPEVGPAVLMCTFAGLVGYLGINSAGLAVMQNSVSTPTWRPEGMPHYFMKRVLLEQTSLNGCLEVLRGAQVCSSGNYVLADASAGQVTDGELTPEGLAIVESPDSDAVVHTNHFLHPDLVPREALLPNLPDSTDRRARMQALVGCDGSLSVPDFQTALRDHQGYPTSICRHQPGLATIASIVAEPLAGRLHIAAGTPCTTVYATYALDVTGT
jgi:isopenicillin-N N-acyltransferase-like protein